MVYMYTRKGRLKKGKKERKGKVNKIKEEKEMKQKQSRAQGAGRFPRGQGCCLLVSPVQ